MSSPALSLVEALSGRYTIERELAEPGSGTLPPRDPGHGSRSAWASWAGRSAKSGSMYWEELFESDRPRGRALATADRGYSAT